MRKIAIVLFASLLLLSGNSVAGQGKFSYNSLPDVFQLMPAAGSEDWQVIVYKPRNREGEIIPDAIAYAWYTPKFYKSGEVAADLEINLEKFTFHVKPAERPFDEITENQIQEMSVGTQAVTPGTGIILRKWTTIVLMVTKDPPPISMKLCKSVMTAVMQRELLPDGRRPLTAYVNFVPWANPETAIYTHWYIRNYKVGEPIKSGSQYSYSAKGIYDNWDFGFDDQITTVKHNLNATMGIGSAGFYYTGGGIVTLIGEARSLLFSSVYVNGESVPFFTLKP